MIARILSSCLMVVVVFCIISFLCGGALTSCAVEESDKEELEFYREYLREQIDEERKNGTFPSKYGNHSTNENDKEKK